MIPSDNTNIKDWADSLRVDFSSRDTIPLIDDDSNWKEWGNIVASSPSFSTKSVPTTEGFPNWQKWGIIVYDTMAR
jgi:hypothetical protein